MLEESIPVRTVDYYPKQLELTDAIFAVINKHLDLLIEVSERHPKYPHLAHTFRSMKAKGGFSRVDYAHHMEPANLVGMFVSVYDSAPNPDQLLLKPVVEGLRQALAEERNNHPQEARNGIFSFLTSDNTIVNLLMSGRER